MSNKCPKGKILRSSYYRKAYTRADGTRVKGTYVKSRCIKDQGKPGKGPKLIGKLRKGTLGNYSVHDTTKERETALRAAVKKEGALSIFRKLNAVATLQKNTNPANSKKFIRDRNFVRRTYASQFKSPISKKRSVKRSYNKKRSVKKSPKRKRRR